MSGHIKIKILIFIFVIWEWQGYAQSSLNRDTVPPSVLQTKVHELPEVNVTTSSFIRKNDYILVIPNKQEFRHAGNGYDLLYNLMIPGMEVDRKKGSVYTLAGAVTLYIDGRKVSYQEIRALRPRDIEKIEYHDVPVGKYANDIAAINYITRQYKSGGYLALDGMQTIGYLSGDYNIATKISKGDMSYSLFAGHAMQRHDGEKNTETENFHFPDSEIERNSRTEGSGIKQNNQYAQLNIQHQNKKYNLTGTLSFVRNAEPERFFNLTSDYISIDKFTRQSYANQNQKNLKPGIDLYCNFKLNEKQSLEIGLHGKYSKNSYERFYNENETSYHTDVDEDIYNMQLSLIYNRTMKHKNSFAAQMYHYHTISQSNYKGDNAVSQHLWNTETLFFLDYSQHFSQKFFYRIHPGASIIRYRLHGENRITSINPRLNVTLTYQPDNRQQLMLICNLGNTHPGINTINNVSQNIDLLQVKRGNPNLENTNVLNPYLIYSVQKGRFSMQGATIYMYSHHEVTDDYYLENEKLINSYSSDTDSHFLSAILSATYKANQYISWTADGRWLRSIVEDKGAQSTWVGLLKMNIYWKSLSCNLYWKSGQKLLDRSTLVHRQVPDSYGLSILWNHSNWMVDANLEVPFSHRNNTRYWLDTGVYDYKKTTYSRINQQIASVKVAYTLNFGYKTARSKRNIDTAVESAILRVQ